MGKIVAIGGGDLSALATEPIDRVIMELSPRRPVASRPNALFIPTASSDSVEYWEAFDQAYRVAYGCDTDVLYLLGATPDPEETALKIGGADIIYVGGGNTLKMMRRWRRLGVNALLRKAHERGAVLCGVSAGAICWFDSGHSDSMSFYHPEAWDYIAVTGMGLVKGLACPHYNGETDGVPRRQSFHDMVRKKGGIGIAIDNDCAIAFVDDGYKVLSASLDAGSYTLFVQDGEVVEKAIPLSEEYLPTTNLYQR